MTAHESVDGPADDTLDRVLSVFRDVLSVGDLTPRSDFFDLGGNSLLAVEVAVQLSEQVGLEVPVADVFVAPTPIELAEAIKARSGG
jgi:acyl carrier protein